MTTAEYLDQMAALIDLARAARTPDGPAAAIAKLQRLSGHALRQALTDARAAGGGVAEWSWLACAAQVHVDRIETQYEAGGRIVVDDPVTPATGARS